MNIFSPSDAGTQLDIAFERFADYYNNASVVATESVSQYLHRARDIFATVAEAVAGDRDKFVAEVVSSKYEVTHLAKVVKYVDFRQDTVSRPEMFSSLYVDYLKDVGEIAQKTYDTTLNSIDNLKLAVATFINEHQDGVIDTLYGARYFEENKKTIEACKKTNASHFKAPQNKTKTTVQQVIKSMTDFEAIFPLVDNAAKSLNQSNIKHLEKQVRDLTDLIDALVEQNIKTGILVKSEGAKKELVAAIDQTAKAVEFYTAMYAEFFGVCSGIKNLNDALIARG